MIGLWIGMVLIALGILTLLGVMGCVKTIPESLLPEDRILDPVKAGCFCPNLDLKYFWLEGTSRHAREVKWLERCRAEHLLREIEEEGLTK